jgi:hypothetical protein
VIEIEIGEGTAKGGVGGQVPVEGNGVVRRAGGDELHWYFRARGARWTLDVGVGEHTEMGWYVDGRDAVWSAGGDWGTWPEAGWMEHETAAAIVRDALARCLRGEPNWKAPADLHRKT